jgi:hypothetical protein
MESKYFEQLLKMNDKIDKNYLSEKEDMNNIKLMLGGLSDTVSKGFKLSEETDEKIDTRLSTVEKETQPGRWGYRNPIKAAIIFVLMVGFAGVIFSVINGKQKNATIKDTVKNVAEIIVKKGL